MKAALIEDPVFDNLTLLKSIDPRLTLEDRYPTNHKGRWGSGKFGLNELVQLLYPAKIGDYERLHQTSMGVRYGQGAIFPIEQIEGMAAGIRSARTEGMLVASPL